jgi:hypothetical protein
METLRIQLSLYPYLVSICPIEWNMLRIPKSRIYSAINRDFLPTFKNFKKKSCEVNFYECNKGHQGYSVILPSISMLLYFIYMLHTR